MQHANVDVLYIKTPFTEKQVTGFVRPPVDVHIEFMLVLLFSEDICCDCDKNGMAKRTYFAFY